MIRKEDLKALALGHAVADALGVPVEFCSREGLQAKPVTKMKGYGTYPVPEGSWSDDTSMALCALEVLARGYCDLDAVMINFGNWLHADAFTPTGKTFDVGNTCNRAIDNYFLKGKPVSSCGLEDERSNGNGSLMRIYPFVAYLVCRDGEITSEGMSLINRASALTHAHERSELGCCIYAFVLEALLKGPNLMSVYDGLAKAKKYLSGTEEWRHYARLCEDGFQNLPMEEIKSSGYVVDTLEAAIWCLLTTGSYEECVLKAVNLGEDTDTVAAVAGSLAGALYGMNGIPMSWLSVLKRRDYIEQLCEKAYEAWSDLSVPKHMVDLHMHVVPKIDDGAETMPKALAMLRMAQEQGVTAVFCTSHSPEVEQNPKRYHENFECLKERAAEEFPSMKLYKGVEIYVYRSGMRTIIAQLKNGIYSTLGGTGYALAEFDMDESAENIEYCLDAFLENGFIPVVAHAERYNAFDNIKFAERMVEKGARIQVNAYSFVDESFMPVKRSAKALLEKKLIHFLGTDGHNTQRRLPRTQEGLRYIYSVTDQEYADAICYKNIEGIL